MSYTLNPNPYLGVWPVDSQPSLIVPRKPLSMSSRLYLNRIAAEDGWAVRRRLSVNSDSTTWETARVGSTGLETTIGSGTIPWVTSAATTTITITSLDTVNQHVIDFTYTWGTTTYVDRKTLTVFDVTGGNSATHGSGNIISLHSFSRPSATHVVWQTENGDLVARTGPS